MLKLAQNKVREPEWNQFHVGVNRLNAALYFRDKCLWTASSDKNYIKKT